LGQNSRSSIFFSDIFQKSAQHHQDIKYTKSCRSPDLFSLFHLHLLMVTLLSNAWFLVFDQKILFVVFIVLIQRPLSSPGDYSPYSSSPNNSSPDNSSLRRVLRRKVLRSDNSSPDNSSLKLFSRAFFTRMILRQSIFRLDNSLPESYSPEKYSQRIMRRRTIRRRILLVEELSQRRTFRRRIFLFFLLSTYEIWKVLISLANFHVLGLFIPKKI
jgi:hypothetical protein